jgi:hypothetical protein
MWRRSGAFPGQRAFFDTGEKLRRFIFVEISASFYNEAERGHEIALF